MFVSNELPAATQGAALSGPFLEMAFFFTASIYGAGNSRIDCWHLTIFCQGKTVDPRNFCGPIGFLIQVAWNEDCTKSP